MYFQLGYIQMICNYYIKYHLCLMEKVEFIIHEDIKPKIVM